MKKILALLMISILLFSTACSTTKKQASAETNSAREKIAEDASSEDVPTEDTPSSDVASDITLRIAWWGNQVRNDVTMDALDLYVTENPNVTFEPEFTDWSGYWDKLAAQAAASDMPDIIQQDFQYLKQFQTKGQLEELTPFIDSGALDVSDVPETILNAGYIEDKLYAISLGNQAICMVYDKDITDEAGVTIEEQMTMEDFVQNSKTIYEKTGVQTRFSSTDQYMRLIGKSNGEDFFTDDDSALGISNETALSYFQLLKTSIDEGWQVPPEVLTDKGPALENNTIVDKTSWNSFIYSTQITGLSPAAARPLEMVLYPLGPGGQQNMYLQPSMPLCITSTSSNKDEAAKVIDFFTNSLEANKLLKAERGVPSSSVVAEGMKEFLTPEAAQNFAYVEKVTQIAIPFDAMTPPGMGELNTLGDDLTEQVQYGQISPQDAADQYLSEGNEILQRAGQ